MQNIASQPPLESLRLPTSEAADTVTPMQQPESVTPETLFATAAKIEAELTQEEKAAHEQSTTIEDVQAKSEALARERAAQELFAKLGDACVDGMRTKSEFVGKWSYYQLSGNKKEFEKAVAKGEPGVDGFNPNYKGTHAKIGYERTQSLSDERFPDTRVEKPLDYIQICKKDIDLSSRKLDGAPDAPQLKEFIAKEGEQFVGVPTREKMYDVKVKDLPPEVGYALFMRQYNGQDPAYRAERTRMLQQETQTSLKTFSDVACKEGDLMTAIEGYITLEKMSDPNVVSVLNSKMEEMQKEWKEYHVQLNTGDPELTARMNEKQVQLQRAARRLEEYRLSHK